MNSLSSKTTDGKMWKLLLYALFFCATLGIASRTFAIDFPNPISANSFPELINKLAINIRQIAIPFSVVAIIFVGFKYVMAGAAGNTGEIAKAHKIFIWVLVGTAIVIGASILAQAVVNFAQKL